MNGVKAPWYRRTVQVVKRVGKESSGGRDGDELLPNRE